MVGARRSLLMGLAASSLSLSAEQVPWLLGLELYSLRRDMEKDVPKTLAFTRQLGFAEVEVPGMFGRTASQFRKELDQAGLACTALVADDENSARGRSRRGGSCADLWGEGCDLSVDFPLENCRSGT